MKLNEEIKRIRKMMGLITENIDTIKDELGDDLSIPVEDYVDSEDPLCTLPQTGNPEEDNILNKVWEWAQQQPMRERFIWPSYELDRGIYSYWK